MNKVLILLTCLLSFSLLAVDYKWEKNAEDSAKLEKSVAVAAREFNFVIRKVASSRLRKATAPYKTLTLTIEGDNVTFIRDGKDPLKAVIGGEPVLWLESKVSFQRLPEGKLKQIFAAEDGTREFIYTFNADKSLAVSVKLTSDKLKKPMEYTLKYVPVQK